MRSTSDFLVASRRISPTLNAAAVSGEYLSAASFLGVAGLVVKDGIGALWYPVGFTAGYVAMLALVAAPMRRTGALTVPDFAEARLGSRAPAHALGRGRPRDRHPVPGAPVQGGGRGADRGERHAVLGRRRRRGRGGLGHARARRDARRHLRAGVPVRAEARAVRRARDLAGRRGRTHRARRRAGAGRVHPVRARDAGAVPPRTTLTVTEPTTVVDDGAPRQLVPGRYPVEAGTTWTFPAGADVPDVGGALPPGGDGWSRPLLDTDGGGHPVLSTLSLLMALVLGTMGLPHIIVRFHTSPDGRSARAHRRHHRRAAQRVLPVPRHLRRARRGAACRSCTSPATPTPSWSRCPRRVDGGSGRRGGDGHALGGRVRGVPRHLARAAARAVRRRRARPAARRGPAAAAAGAARGRRS